MSAQPEPLLSVDDVATILGVGRRTVFKLVERGELARVKIGTRTLFTAADVRAFIATHRVGAAGETTSERPTAGALRALHGKANELDRRDGERSGTWKRVLLRKASEELGREITSANDLTHDEMSWALDWLAEELGSR